RAAPEIALEPFGLLARAANGETLRKDRRPGCDRDQQKDCHHDLHHQGGFRDERENRKVSVHCYGFPGSCPALIAAASWAGRRAGTRRTVSTHATFTRARARSSAPRSALCSNTRYARASSPMRAVMVS